MKLAKTNPFETVVPKPFKDAWRNNAFLVNQKTYEEFSESDWLASKEIPMKRLIVSGLAFAAIATAALAQQAPAPAEQTAPAPTQDHASPPPQPGHPDAMDHPDEMWPRDHVDQTSKDTSRQDMGMRRHRWPMSLPSKAAHFRIEDGDKKIDIKCADDEPTKVCADVLLQLIDKLATPSDMSDDERD